MKIGGCRTDKEQHSNTFVVTRVLVFIYFLTNQAKSPAS